MSTKRQLIQSRNKALVAWSMRNEGYTTNEIATQLGYKPHQVKSAVERGERLNSLNEG